MVRIACFLILILMTGCEQLPPEPKPTAMPFESFQPPPQVNGDGVRFAIGPVMRIQWASTEVPGATPLEVLQATYQEMEYLQSTPQGSDQNAKAMFSLLESIDYLNGTNEVTGTPLGSQGD